MLKRRWFAFLLVLATAAGCAGGGGARTTLPSSEAGAAPGAFASAVISPGDVPPAGTGLGFQEIYSFRSKADGTNPFGRLIAVPNGRGISLFGTTYWGGKQNAGTIYALLPAANGCCHHVKIYDFTGGENGSHPAAGLILHDGLLWGTTAYGGKANSGVMFVIKPNGEGFRVVHTFGLQSDGANPMADLYALQLRRGAVQICGTTRRGGHNGKGIAFCYGLFEGELRYRTLYEFGLRDSGAYPSAPLTPTTLRGDAMYGTTEFGGNFNYGMVYRVDGSHPGYTPLYQFKGREAPGGNSVAGVTVDPSNAHFVYGTLAQGGPGCPFVGCGGVFRLSCDINHCDSITPVAFDAGTHPKAALIAKGGSFYGTMANGGSHNDGTLFAFPSGATRGTVLHVFAGPDGAHPVTALLDAGNALYGTTANGGSFGNGSVFAYVLSLPTATPSPTPAPTGTPSPTPTPKPTPTPTATPTPTPSPGKFFAYAMSLKPLAYYRLDATSGTTVSDFSGNGYNGTLAGSAKLGVPGLLQGDDDPAVQLTGGAIALPAMANRDTFTLVTLARADTYAGSRALVGYRSNYLAIDGGKLKWCPTLVGCSDSSSPGLTAKKAYMFAIVVRIPQSGQATVTCSTNGAALVNCNRNRFGSRSLLSPGNSLGSSPLFANYRGVLDESLIYPNALTQAEVTKLAKEAGLHP